VDARKAHPCVIPRVFEPLCVKIYPCVTSVWEGEPGNKINHNTRQKSLYFTYLLRRFVATDLHNFGLRVGLVDVIICAQFYRNRLMGLDFVSGRILTTPKAMSLLTLLELAFCCDSFITVESKIRMSIPERFSSGGVG